MAEFMRGQYVRVMNYDDLCRKYDLIDSDFENGVDVCGIRFVNEMRGFCGETFGVEDVDNLDFSVLLSNGDDAYWFPFDVLIASDDEDLTFGFKVGDRVVFKDYEDMRSDGSLRYSCFAPEMRYLCGVTATIVEFGDLLDRCRKVEIECDDADLKSYFFTTAMFSHLDENEIEIRDDDWAAIALA